MAVSNIVSSPTTIAYLPTALGASKTTLLLSNNITGGPYAWQLPQCTISSNPYSGGGYTGLTGTYGLLNCVAIEYGAISVVVWFYEPPGGQGVLFGGQSYAYPSGSYNSAPALYVGEDGRLFALEMYPTYYVSTQTPIGPGWHMAVFEEWAQSTSGPYYIALFLDGQFIGQASGSTARLFGLNINGPEAFNYIGVIGAAFFPDTPYANTGGAVYYFFNGAIAFVALYNRVLTTGDVLAIYQGNLVTSGLVAVWYGDDYDPSNGYWVSRIGGYTGAPITSSYPPRGCILWNSTWYSGPVGIWSNWQQC